MKNSIVRVERIELQNFKNVKNGIIDLKNNLTAFEEYELKANVLGIYGQNGSGKTAIIDAFKFLKLLVDGEGLPRDAANYISLEEENAFLKFDFYIKILENEYLASYEFEITKSAENKVIINKEKLSYALKNATRRNRVVLIEYDNSDDNLIKPTKQFNKILTNTDNMIDLKVAQKICAEKSKSFLFCEEVKNILFKSQINNIDKRIIEVLVHYSRINLFVINNDHNGVISINLFMPFSFRLEDEMEVTSGDIGVALSEPTIINKEAFSILNSIINQMNIVLSKIIPGLELELFNYGEQLDSKGNVGIKIEIVSVKNDKKLPVKYESEGIKKIISIMSALIAMYNNPSVCMVVDELDSGIYEYLLGEILTVIESGGKGQLIFTSHNLRPLEIVNKESIYFTTTNEKNRYIRFSNVKSNNNLRNFYIRSIVLGGQKENIYKETSKFKIQKAFRVAGEKYEAN